MAAKTGEAGTLRCAILTPRRNRVCWLPDILTPSRLAGIEVVVHFESVTGPSRRVQSRAQVETLTLRAARSNMVDSAGRRFTRGA